MKLFKNKEPFAFALVLGSVMAIIGNALHPRDPEEKMPVPELTAHLQEHNGDIWLAAHSLLLLMIPILTIGFIGLFRYLYKLEKNYSLIGIVLVSMWSVLSLFVFITDGFMGPLFTDRSFEAYEYNYFFGLVITVVSFLFFGPAIAAFSWSAIKAKVFSHWLNWLGIAIGIVTVVGYPLGLFGTYMVYSPIFPIYAGISTLWSLIVGLQILGIGKK